MKLSEIAARLQLSVEGNANVEITGPATVDAAGPGQITFLANPRYGAAARVSKASAIIVPEGFSDTTAARLASRNPRLDFARVLSMFYQPPQHAPGVHPTAVVSPKAKIGADASIGPYVTIEDDVIIGDNCVLHPHTAIYRGVNIGDNFVAHSHVVIREFCRIGNNVILQNGVVIGADGFGFERAKEGWVKVPQIGIVVIEDDVEIQALACIDRAAMGETRIGRGVKIDNLVQVGHNVQVGEHSLLCGQVGIAGSTTIGKNVILAGQVGVGGHLSVGDGVIATGQTGITNNIEPGKNISGNPAMDTKPWLRSMALFVRLPELAKMLRGKKPSE